MTLARFHPLGTMLCAPRGICCAGHEDVKKKIAHLYLSCAQGKKKPGLAKLASLCLLEKSIYTEAYVQGGCSAYAVDYISRRSRPVNCATRKQKGTTDDDDDGDSSLFVLCIQISAVLGTGF